MEISLDSFSPDSSNQYRILESIGEGTFGEVKKAIDKKSGNQVAIKYVRLLSKKSSGIPKAIFREMEAMKQLRDESNIVKLYNIYASEVSLCLVMEYAESNLAEVIEKSKSPIPRSHLKTYYHMMLSAINYCHERNIIHRDIKPSNFLLTRYGTVKLADFGLARIYDATKNEDLSHQVATRQYRAPELLFASRRYSSAVDIYSFAVIAIELINLKPLFPSMNDLDQMFKTFQLLGSPTPERWPGVELLPDFGKVSFPDLESIDLSFILPTAHQAEIDFILLSFQIDPKKRISASSALSLPYFLSSLPLPASTFELSVPLSNEKKKSTRKPIKNVDEFFNLYSTNI